MSPGKEIIAARVRFAPSPTGRLHLGSARTALFNWLVARGSGGKMILRLEDTDSERSSSEYEEDIIEMLHWLGIEWDEGPDLGGDHGPYRQSERSEIYAAKVEELMESGKAYRCFCTTEELGVRRKASIADGRAWRYDRKCTGMTPEEEKALLDAGTPYTVRFRVPEQTIVIDDMLRGEVKVDSSQIDDFIIVRSDGSAGFHLAVVADDATMGITHVIRGDDHLTNAARHVLLFEAMGVPAPRFLHHSLLMGADGSKLSKRHGSTSVCDYREKGYLPETMINYLGLLSWSPGDDREIFSKEQLVADFNVKGVSASKAIFDFDKLNWINRQHIKLLDASQLAERAAPFLEGAGLGELLALPPARLEIAVESARNGTEVLSDLPDLVRLFVRPSGDPDEKALRDLRKVSNLDEVLDLCVEVIGDDEEVGMDGAETIVTALRDAAAEREWGAGKLLKPFRLAVTGLTVGPDLTYLLMFWGPAGCVERINATRSRLEADVE